ncbi:MULTISPECIES: LysR family transcriptional regulator [Mesorhizobium]|uniref:LysR family transcriptional regulator n=2 Tax=Mesorhizobium TaxID=68287 RepID=A0A1A5JX04_RHILI|nr:MULTISPECIES: LysR family transcriptional regulator [Mesorhizobium]MBE1706189.1 LysR family transcriptional regulator [Mesorhizobium japonicum]MBE1715300.1 LysR family transcriptional regulator [Mesorhizobium japonicum]MUT21886.1 LysR family transcriptional regulator [Mesorhizobium japonicum]MUT27737.1 LysR family transcriptional regulator [Mesorhizobium japonicum]OBP74338.1 LysR family transcriptional regulator [Mesorhizobium loti]
MQPNPTLDQLQIFVAVADSGSFSAAGRKLNRAQSVISYGIANLEAQLGLKLFEREGTREPQLTEIGRAMLEDARRMIGVLQRMRSRVDGHHHGLEAEVALSVDAALPSPVLVRVLKAFEAQFPTVMLRLHIGSLGLIPDHVVSGQADLGIGGLLGDVDVHLVRIGFMSIVLAAAPSHPLALLPKPLAIEDVREHTQLVVTDQSERTKGRDFGVFAYRTWRLTDMRTKHMLMREGLGWGGLPRWLIADDLVNGRLVELDLEPFSEVKSPMFAMHRNDSSPKPAAAWLIERFKRGLGCFNEFEPGEVPEDEPETIRQSAP